jgi:hypothetical protein
MERESYAIVLCTLSLLLTPLCAGEAINDRPALKAPPSEVWFFGYILDIHSINSSDQSFTGNVFYRLRWQDARLAGASTQNRILPLEAVWHPQLQIINQQKVWKTFPDEVSVSPQGEVLYRQRVCGSFSQPMNLREFPFDRQTFMIQLAASGLDARQFQMLPDPAAASAIAANLSLAGWTIKDIQAQSAPYAPLPNYPALPGFAIRFTAARQMGYYLFKILLPLVLIVTMSWLGFWIHPTQAGVQISVAVTSMLTLIAFRFMISGFLPSISYLTRLDKLVLGSTILVFAALVEVITTANLASRDAIDRALTMDRRSRVLFPLLFLLLVLGTLVI